MSPALLVRQEGRSAAVRVGRQPLGTGGNGAVYVQLDIYRTGAGARQDRHTCKTANSLVSDAAREGRRTGAAAEPRPCWPRSRRTVASTAERP